MNIHIMNKEISVWQIMFYVSWAVLSLWLILKVAGVIKTPIWLEYGVPIGSLILGVFWLYHNLIQTINCIIVELTALTNDVRHLDSKVNHLELDMGIVKKKLQKACTSFINKTRTS